MVFGIGEGKIEIILPKQDYVFGETIKGKIVLTLNKPRTANGLRVEIRAYEKYNQQHWIAGSNVQGHVMPGHYVNELKTFEVYQFTLQLDKEKMYSSSEYGFELKLPEGGASTPNPNPMNPVANFLTNFMVQGAIPGMSVTSSHFPIDWHIVASLNIPLAFDITKNVQIQVSPVVQQATPTIQPQAPSTTEQKPQP